MENKPYIQLIVIRGNLLRTFSHNDEHGVGFDAPEMSPLHKEDEHLPNTRIMVDYVDKEKGEAGYSLRQFTETNITLKPNEARDIFTLDNEKITIGFGHIRSGKSLAEQGEE